MKNNKGFTIIEVLAVVMILGILVSIATISISRYRGQVDEKEIVTLKSTISAGYDNYRQKQLINGGEVLSKKSFCNEGVMFIDISYAGKKLTCDDIKVDSFVELKIKGDLLTNQKYYEEVNKLESEEEKEEKYIKDGACLIGTEVKDNQFVKSCIKSGDTYEKSRGELLCIYLETNDKVLIDDFNDENSLCKYFGR